jgi:hypothetical protein
MSITQPLLFRLSEEDAKECLASSVLLSKQLSGMVMSLVEETKDMEPEEQEKFIRRAFATKTRKFHKQKSRPVKMTAHKLFKQEQKETIKSQVVGGGFAEYGKMQAKLWAEVKADDSKLADYTTRAHQYNEEHGLLVETPKKRTGFILFTNEHRASVQERLGTKEISKVSKELGSLWKSLEQSERDSWMSKASMELQVEQPVVVDEQPVEQVEQVVEKKSKKKKKSKK